MVVEALAAGLGGANMLWKYNRANYMYDKEMRLKQEFQVMSWRTEAAELWRDDIREIVGLTEKRMDTYLIVSALQLDMCVGLFCEGRMEPGTPPWLINLYMLTLGGAFMYLLLAIWLAMHAAVVAQCSSVRLLTQFVRLPVPTWPHLEAARTYASGFEELSAKRMLRIPFIGKEEKPGEHTMPEPTAGTRAASSRPAQPLAPAKVTTVAAPRVLHPAAKMKAAGSSSPAMGAAAAAAAADEEAAEAPSEPAHVDTWDTERYRSDIYELLRTPAQFAHHVGLAKKAAQHYHCYDAFARVAMSFGTNQLLSALAYYAMGYCSVQDRAMSAAWFVLFIVCSIACVLIELDIALSRKDRLISQALILAGPVSTTFSTYAWVMHDVEFGHLVRFAYASHCLWLLFAIRKLKVERQASGLMLPMRFRPTLYLDIFGWLRKSRTEKAAPRAGATGYQALANDEGEEEELESDDEEVDERSGIIRRARSDLSLFEAPEVIGQMEAHDRDRVEKLAVRLRAKEKAAAKSAKRTTSGDVSAKSKKGKIVKFKGYTDAGTESPYYVDSRTGEIVHQDEDAAKVELIERKRVRSITQAERNLDRLETLDEEDETQESGRFKLAEWMREEAEPLDWHPVGTPKSKLMRKALAALPALGPKTTSDRDGESLEKEAESDEEEHPDDMFDIFATFPHAGDNVPVMNETAHAHPGKTPWKLFRLATTLLVVLWAVSFILPLRLFKVGSSTVKHREEIIGDLRFGVQLRVGWPTHSGFVPKALSCDSSGRRLLVSDDFGVYTLMLPAKLSQRWKVGPGNSSEDNIIGVAERDITDFAEETVPPATSALTDGLAILPARARAALRGTAAIAKVRHPVATFQAEPDCNALEDQALVDVDLLCPEDEHAACHALVLHGSNLTMCPLLSSAGMGADRTTASDDKRVITYTISNDWLETDDDGKSEEIQSAVVNGNCVRDAASDNPLDFSAPTAGGVSCVVVGTTQGRVVQLRPNMLEARSLVPERAFQRRSEGHPATRGTLHIFEGHLIMVLRPVLGTVQALRADEGAVVGEWRLPKGIRWSALCGGGGSLFLLGHAEGRGFSLWRFPIPPELDSRLRQQETDAKATVHEF